MNGLLTFLMAKLDGYLGKKYTIFWPEIRPCLTDFHQWDAYPRLTPATSFPPAKLDKGLYYVNSLEPYVSSHNQFPFVQ